MVTNSKRSDAEVLSIAQGRGNQENLIKDFKHGLGLSHVPTGVLAANQAYFLIAALAWNLKTWMLNLLRLGDGAVSAVQAVSVSVDQPSGGGGQEWAGRRRG